MTGAVFGDVGTGRSVAPRIVNEASNVMMIK